MCIIVTWYLKHLFLFPILFDVITLIQYIYQKCIDSLTTSSINAAIPTELAIVGVFFKNHLNLLSVKVYTGQLVALSTGRFVS